jgi:hypothetical protein
LQLDEVAVGESLRALGEDHGRADGGMHEVRTGSEFQEVVVQTQEIAEGRITTETLRAQRGKCSMQNAQLQMLNVRKLTLTFCIVHFALNISPIYGQQRFRFTLRASVVKSLSPFTDLAY